MTNNMDQSTQNANMNQAGQVNANALTNANSAAANSKIEQSMREYGTYTATSDANNEYPPKNQAGANMDQSSPQNQTTSSAMQNKQSANMANSSASAGQSAQTSGTLTAQYDANGKP